MYLCSWFDGLIRSQQTVSTLYQIMGFQHIFRGWLSCFVPSFIFEWWFHTFLPNLGNKASVVQLMKIFYKFDECLTVHRRWHEESKINSMLHNGLLDLMNRSTCFRHYCVHHQELTTIQMVSAYGSSRWLWQVAGLVHGCRFFGASG